MKDNSGFYIPVLSALVLMGVVLTIKAFAALPDEWASYICKKEDCTAQAWLSASAGWIGFLAAAVGAYFVYGQLAEQRRQTSFMLGDALPTLEMDEFSTKTASGKLILVNWNRRILVFQELEIRSALLLPRVTRIDCEHMGPEREKGVVSAPVDRNGVFKSAFGLGGYVNRSLAPNRYKITFAFAASTFSEDNYLAEVDNVCEVVLRCRYGGSLYDAFEVRANVPHWNLLPNPRALFD